MSSNKQPILCFFLKCCVRERLLCSLGGRGREKGHVTRAPAWSLDEGSKAAHTQA